ncbi:MAG: hypothetical protein ACT4OX_03715 [Actinomycetota bacterium]
MPELEQPETGMRVTAWEHALAYLQHLADNDVVAATDILDRAIDAEGIGAMNDALSDACRALMDRVTFAAGTIDVHTVVDRIATRVVSVSHDDDRNAIDRQRSLVVFLGSEGLPCAARADVATWSPIARLRATVACTIGLLGIVAEDDAVEITEVVAALEPPPTPEPARGTFGLAWRGPDVDGNGSRAEPFAGVVPRGYTAHITFLGAGTCSLRSIFARVASLRDARALSALPKLEAAPPST